jgi:hypothetical protein
VIPKKLAQFVASMAETTVYQVPVDDYTILKEVLVANTSSTKQTFSLSVVPEGNVVGPANRLLPTVPIGPNSVVTFSFTTVMVTGDYISVRASAEGALTVTISGLEDIGDGISAGTGASFSSGMLVTSTTRPGTPYEGQVIYETDTDLLRVWTGAAWTTIVHQTGNYTITGGLVTTGGFVAQGSTAGVNFDGFGIQKTGALSASNISFALSHRSNNTDLLLYGYNGTTFKNFMQFNYAADTMQLLQHTSLDQKELRLYSSTNSDHKIMYKLNPGGGNSDGPWITGHSKGHLGTTNGGEQWQFAWQSDGWSYGRSGLSTATLGATWIRGADGNGYALLICRNGGNRTGGNGASFNWDGSFRMYVEDTNVKTFVIDHPTDNERHLIHACIEGPENAVFYRGAGELVNGKVTIKLPEYFEALCAEEGRSVQLTCIADSAEDEWCPVLHATYPTNGEFHVGLGSGMVIPDQRFWWEVKAVRKDVEPLLVEPGVGDIEVLGDGPYTYYRRTGKAAPRSRVSKKAWPNKTMQERPYSGRHPSHPEVLDGPQEEEA